MSTRSVAPWLLALALGASAWANPPLGGDDSGFVPSSTAIARCQDRAAKNVARLGICLTKCHVTLAGSRFDAQTSDDEFCEASCVVKYQEKAVAILLRNECPVCLDQTGFGSALGAFLDEQNGLFYCAGVVPIGGDESGFVPPDHGTLECETRTLIKGANLARCVLHCHAQAATRRVTGGSFEEEACEDRCQTKLVAASYPGTCPSCLAFLPGVAGTVRDFLDQANALIYCESPGGAFLAD